MRGLIALVALALAGCAAPPDGPAETWVDPLAGCESIGYERFEVDPEFRLREFPMSVIDVPVCRDEVLP